MNYFVIGIGLLACAAWLIVIVIGAIAKTGKAAVTYSNAAAEGFGADVGKLFRRGIRHLSRNWVSVEIPANLTPYELQISDGYRALNELQSWKPADLKSGAMAFPVFQPFLFPECRGAGSRIHLRDLIRVRQMTNPAPSNLLEILASRDCVFPSRPPKPLLRETSWPEPLKPVDLTLPHSRFDLWHVDLIRRRISLWAYRDERALATATSARINKMARQAELLNASITKANSSLVNDRAVYDANYDSQNTSIAEAYSSAAREFVQKCAEETNHIRAVRNAYKMGDSKGVLLYFRLGLRMLALPDWASTSFEIGFDETGRALIIEVQLPNLPEVHLTKTVTTPTGKNTQRAPAKREAAVALKTLHPLLLLRIACEVARHDIHGKLGIIAVNGWVSYRSRATGQPLRAFVGSLVGDPKEFRGISLPDADALAAFQHFRGQSAFVVDDVVPMKPDLRLDHNDPRFVAAKDILKGLESQMNLATMEWQDFEHLIRELFERLYRGQGVEVKVTQASRDRGVDAVVLDPDPIRGGKIVIQAKRYVNVVDVSAVRDLFGTVHNEGASRGILITTSSFGPDAYQFVQGKPLTLINGNQLLAYLKEAGKDVRIDLEEARRLAHS